MKPILTLSILLITISQYCSAMSPIPSEAKQKVDPNLIRYQLANQAKSHPIAKPSQQPLRVKHAKAWDPIAVGGLSILMGILGFILLLPIAFIGYAPLYFIPLLLALAALIYGIASIARINKKKGKGRGLGIAGIVLGGFTVLIYLGILMVLFINQGN